MSPAFIDLLRLLGLLALGMLSMGWIGDGRAWVGGYAGLFAGYVLAGLRAPAGELWRRVCFAWLAFSLFCVGLFLAVAMISLHGLDWRLPEYWEDVRDFMREVFFVPAILSPPVLLGGGIAWLIRRWRSRTCAS